METLSALMAHCAGNPQDSPHKEAIMQIFDIFLVVSVQWIVDVSVIADALMLMWLYSKAA